MKTSLALVCAFALALITARAQEPSAPPATTTASTNKVDIKELIKEPSFTNATGMVMIKVSDSLWAGKYEVTQDEYQKVAGANPSKFADGHKPVDSISWNDARNFCTKLNEVEKLEEMLPEGFAYTIPTQAQWESFAVDVKLKDAVTSEKSSRASTAPVGSLGANQLGLYDLRGNVWEFCLDPQDKPYRVLRGGAWNTFYEPNLRQEFLWFADGPNDRKEIYGFRCVLAPGTAK